MRLRVAVLALGISALLLAYGAAAFAGNALGGQAADRWGATRSIVVALSSQSA